MGYRIETYSLSELNRISIPGKVIPSLFWLIPVGKWEYFELERLWRYFTQNQNLSSELGLMLVKNLNIWDSNNSVEQISDLSDLTGKLSELLPSGVTTIYDHEHLWPRDQTHQVLILSGSYPQPGWGVLISLKEYIDIKSLLYKVLVKIDPDLRTTFIHAAEAFKLWDSTKNARPIRGDSKNFIEKRAYCIELITILNKLIEEHTSESINDYYYTILKLKAKEKAFEEISEIVEPLLAKIDEKFILSILIHKCADDISNDEINDTLTKFISANNSETKNLFKSEKNPQLKKIASFLLRVNDAEKPIGQFVFWAKEFYARELNEIKSYTLELRTRLNSILGELVLAIENIEGNYRIALNEWRAKSESSRLPLNEKLQKVVKMHLSCSPDFLIQIESQARRMNLIANSISWDPPRMIGWKILNKGIRIERFDIITHIRDMLPEISDQLTEEFDKGNTLINGSIFTDYIHYFSMASTNSTPRNATKLLLERLLRPAEIYSLLTEIPSNIRPRLTPSQLVENLLIEFGWPLSKTKYENKLAECIEIIDGVATINRSFSGNDIRIICESFSKDLVDTLSTKIGYTEEELINLVFLKYPTYEFQNRGWNYEISRMTVGKAVFIISALLDEVFPDKKLEAQNLIKNLKILNTKLNPLSHHPPIEIDTVNLAVEISNILNHSKEILVEMPWHFYPVQRYGHQPIVLTGDAWSHSYKHNRQLSIIIWSDNTISEKMLVWNPTKENPVIPDGIVINRP